MRTSVALIDEGRHHGDIHAELMNDGTEIEIRDVVDSVMWISMSQAAEFRDWLIEVTSGVAVPTVEQKLEEIKQMIDRPYTKARERLAEATKELVELRAKLDSLPNTEAACRMTAWRYAVVERRAGIYQSKLDEIE